jgi:hypothetical protein
MRGRGGAKQMEKEMEREEGENRKRGENRDPSTEIHFSSLISPRN